MPLIAGRFDLIILLNLSGPNLKILVLVVGVSSRWVSMMSAQWSFVFNIAYLRSHDIFIAKVKSSSLIIPSPPCFCGAVSMSLLIQFFCVFFMSCTKLFMVSWISSSILAGGVRIEATYVS